MLKKKQQQEERERVVKSRMEDVTNGEIKRKTGLH